MDSENEVEIKKVKLMNPYVQLNKAFIVNTTSSMIKLFNNEATSDVTVVLGDNNKGESNCDKQNVLHLHKLVLSSGSHFFSTWLEKYSEKSGNILLKIPENYSWMPDFFRFFYSGQLMMTSENLVDIYIVADKYLVESLKVQCEDHIKECLKIKYEKLSCSHMKTVLSKYSDDDSPLDPIGFLDYSSGSFYSRPYQMTAIGSGRNAGIFNNYNQPTTRGTCSTQRMYHVNNSTGSSSSIFNNSSTFSRSFCDIFEKKDTTGAANVNSPILRMDRPFCSKCVPGPLSVSRVLAFSTLVQLVQTMANADVRRLALFNLMVRLTEELRQEDFLHFVQLPFGVLVDLLEDDNFYCPEYSLFCALVSWVEANNKNSKQGEEEDGCVDACQQQADKLVKLIRMPIMSPEDIYEVEKRTLDSGLFSDVVLKKLVNEAIRHIVYRNVPKAKVEMEWIGPVFKSRNPVDIIQLASQT